MPKVSIIIPVYNIESYLPKCLESAVSQTFTDIEIVCVNDGSKDSSPRIIRQFAEGDSRIRCIDKANGGLPAARRTGIDHATGDYIFHLDGDDDIPLDTIESLVREAEQSGCDIVVGDYTLTEADGSTTVINSEIEQHIDSNAYMRYILNRGLFNVWGKLYKRDLYANDVTLPPHISMAEDLVHVFQMAYYAKTIAPCHKLCYNYYIRSSSMSKNNSVGQLVDRSILAVEFINNFYKTHKIDCLDNEINHYLCNFVYTYLLSPHPVSLHRDRLKAILADVNDDTIARCGSFKRLSLRLAKINLTAAKALVKAVQKIRH